MGSPWPGNVFEQFESQGRKLSGSISLSLWRSLSLCCHIWQRILSGKVGLLLDWFALLPFVTLPKTTN